MRRVLPWAAAVAVPSVLFGVAYLSQGDHPAWGLVAGVIGLIGALSAELAQVVLEHRRAVAAPEEVSAGKITAGTLRAEITLPQLVAAGLCCEAGALAHPDPCPWHYDPPHEGVARLHRDIHADERDRPPE